VGPGLGNTRGLPPQIRNRGGVRRGHIGNLPPRPVTPTPPRLAGGTPRSRLPPSPRLAPDPISTSYTLRREAATPARRRRAESGPSTFKEARRAPAVLSGRHPQRYVYRGVRPFGSGSAPENHGPHPASGSAAPTTGPREGAEEFMNAALDEGGFGTKRQDHHPRSVAKQFADLLGRPLQPDRRRTPSAARPSYRATRSAIPCRGRNPSPGTWEFIPRQRRITHGGSRVMPRPNSRVQNGRQQGRADDVWEGEGHFCTMLRGAPGPAGF